MKGSELFLLKPKVCFPLGKLLFSIFILTTDRHLRTKVSQKACVSFVS